MNILFYVKWKLSNWTISDIVYWSGFSLIMIGLFLPKSYDLWVTGIGLAIWVIAVFNILVWPQLKQDYQRFLEERNQLFETIKNSDKQ